MADEIAPWPDFLGQQIKHGDRLTHPDGIEFVAVRLVGHESESDAWRAVYDDTTVSRLCLQIGDKGQAVLASAALSHAAGQEVVVTPAFPITAASARNENPFPVEVHFKGLENTYGFGIQVNGLDVFPYASRGRGVLNEGIKICAMPGDVITPFYRSGVPFWTWTRRDFPAQQMDAAALHAIARWHQNMAEKFAKDDAAARSEGEDKVLADLVRNAERVKMMVQTRYPSHAEVLSGTEPGPGFEESECIVIPASALPAGLASSGMGGV